MKLIIAYIQLYYHFVRYQLANFKMWRIMQLIRFLAFITKDDDYRKMYITMHYKYDHSGKWTWRV